jgi:HSP20 family protein
MYLTRTRRTEPATGLFTNWTRLNRMMDEALSGWEGEAVGSAWTPTCDVREDKENLIITLDLPGVKPEDVKISLENQILTIRGEKRQESEQNEDRWHRYERSYGSFERSFTLPTTVDPERIEATTEHGVLTVRLPKSERAKPKEIPIRTSAGFSGKPETVSTKNEVTR